MKNKQKHVSPQLDKSKCTGCAACYSACPKGCIRMQEDNEGFLYPIVNENECIDCGLCQRICPTNVTKAPSPPKQILAIKNKQTEVRMRSSSGAVFSLLAEYVLKKGGVVFGAAFDEKWEVVHTYIERREELDGLRRSKYAQSRIGDTYTKVKKFLGDGRLVLFTGSPCQIAGLSSFLQKKHENLLMMDFVCHSVPSPKVWRKYLAELYTQITTTNGDKNFLSNIKDINFRDKTSGWKDYSFCLSLRTPRSEQTTTLRIPYYKNLYMNFFLSDTISRPSCSMCNQKQGRSGADITVGDYWWINAVHPKLDDDKGCSVVYIFTEKGCDAIRAIKDDAEILQTDTKAEIKNAYLFTGAYAECATPNKTRKKLFNELDEKTLQQLQPLSIRVKSPKERIFEQIKAVLSKLHLFNSAKSIYILLKK